MSAPVPPNDETDVSTATENGPTFDQTKKRRLNKRERNARKKRSNDLSLISTVRGKGVVSTNAAKMLVYSVQNRTLGAGLLKQPMASQLVKGDKNSEGRECVIPGLEDGGQGAWCLFRVCGQQTKEGSKRHPRMTHKNNPSKTLLSKGE